MGRKNRSVANSQFWESAIDNNASYMQYYYRLVELAISMFEWKNLPDSVDPRFLELSLFTEGQAVFFRDEELGFLGLRCATNGGFNVYRVPINRRAYADNGYNRQLTDKDSVIIYNNYLRTNSMLDTVMFAKRLYNLDRAIDVNANAQKTPLLLRCEQSQRLTLLNLYKQYDGNTPVIYGDKSLSTTPIEAISTGAPYVCDKLYQLKTQIWNEALTYLGISNINIQKKERLISDEVTRNQGGTIASRYSRLNARRQACNEINQLFGLNIWCDCREDYQPVRDDGEDSETSDEGGVIGE